MGKGGVRRREKNILYREINQCGWNGVPRKFLDKLTTQLHYMTRCKMDEENLAGIMFCFPNCNLFEGFNGCCIKTSWAPVRFHCVSPSHDWWPPLPRLLPVLPPRTPPLSAFSADLQGILNISYIYMDAGISNWFSYRLISLHSLQRADKFQSTQFVRLLCPIASINRAICLGSHLETHLSLSLSLSHSLSLIMTVLSLFIIFCSHRSDSWSCQNYFFFPPTMPSETKYFFYL